jgi:hypothetical protein
MPTPLRLESCREAWFGTDSQRLFYIDIDHNLVTVNLANVETAIAKAEGDARTTSAAATGAAATAPPPPPAAWLPFGMDRIDALGRCVGPDPYLLRHMSESGAGGLVSGRKSLVTGSLKARIADALFEAQYERACEYWAVQTDESKKLQPDKDPAKIFQNRKAGGTGAGAGAAAADTKSAAPSSSSSASVSASAGVPKPKGLDFDSDDDNDDDRSGRPAAGSTAAADEQKTHPPAGDDSGGGGGGGVVRRMDAGALLFEMVRRCRDVSLAGEYTGEVATCVPVDPDALRPVDMRKPADGGGASAAALRAVMAKRRKALMELLTHSQASYAERLGRPAPPPAPPPKQFTNYYSYHYNSPPSQKIRGPAKRDPDTGEEIDQDKDPFAVRFAAVVADVPPSWTAAVDPDGLAAANKRAAAAIDLEVKDDADVRAAAAAARGRRAHMPGGSTGESEAARLFNTTVNALDDRTLILERSTKRWFVVSLATNRVWPVRLSIPKPDRRERSRQQRLRISHLAAVQAVEEAAAALKAAAGSAGGGPASGPRAAAPLGSPLPAAPPPLPTRLWAEATAWPAGSGPITVAEPFSWWFVPPKPTDMSVEYM